MVIKTRTAIIKRIDNIIEKKFINTLKPDDAHRLGPKYCVCGSKLRILLDNEVNILKKLQKYNHFPKIKSVDYKNNSYKMTYCGETLSYLKRKKKLKIPSDWIKQINEISNALSDINIYNNDIALSNICILNNIIYMIDFGCCQPLDVKIKEKFDNRDNYKDLYNLLK